MCKTYQAAGSFVQENGVELVTGMEGHWSAFDDPDGNLLTVRQRASLPL